MIVNLIAVDPRDATRVLQYRVPENSREIELLQEALDNLAIEYALVAKRTPAPKLENA